MDTQKTNRTQQRETEQLTELLALIHLALKNIQLYPPGHSLVKTRLAVAHQLLTKVLNTKKNLLFGIARDIITFKELPLGKESPACAAFAKILSRHEIASLSFSAGVSQHSLFLFLKEVGILPEQNQSGKNLQQKLSSLHIPHIEIETIDYNYFDRTDTTDPNTINGASAPLTWLSFSQKLTSGILGYVGNGKGTANSPQLAAPETLAAAINKHSNKHPEVIQQFSTLLDQMLRQGPQSNDTSASFGGKELSRILASLNPSLRDQFLNTTLERCDQNMSRNSPEKVLEKFSDSVVLDMVKQVNKKEVTVSPALLNLIEKLSRMRFTAATATPASITGQENIDDLLTPEHYNKHVDPQYHSTLQKLAGSPSAPPSPSPEFPLDEHLASLEEDHLNRQIVRATLLFMDSSEREKEYAELSAKLMEICQILPDSGAFDLLISTNNTLQQHAAEKKSEAVRKIATQCIQQLTEPDFIDYVFSILPEISEQEKQEAINFLSLLCPGILDKLLKIFCMKPKVPEDDPLVTLFKAFRMESLTRIFTVLPKVSTINMQRLLVLVQYLGLQGTVRLLHPLLDHEETNIRLQVLDLLLPINDDEAVATLVSMLESKDEYTVDSAIEICNNHTIAAVVPNLLKLLQYTFVKQAAIERNRKLFLILGRIGDPQALPSLEKIAFTKWPLLRQEVATMKRILFYSLKGYRDRDRINLVKKGMKINDDEIRKICQTLILTS